MKNTLNKKSIFTAVSICLFILITAFLCACGSAPATPWSKTLKYAGVSNVDQTYTINKQGKKLSKICVDYFDKIDWEQTLGQSKESLQNGENAFETLKTKLVSQFDTDALSKFEITFGSEAEKTATINGQTFNVIEDESGYNFVYKTIDNVDYKFYIHSQGNAQFSFNYNDNQLSEIPMFQSNMHLYFLDDSVVDENIGGSLYLYSVALFK